MVVYRITNAQNGKVYIGCTVRPVGARFSHHLSAARQGKAQWICAAIRKHGVAAFGIKVIGEATSIEEMLRLEQQQIAAHCSQDPGRGYNMTAGGEGLFGHRHSAESKRLMSVHAKKRFSDPVERARLLVISARAGKKSWSDPAVRRRGLERLKKQLSDPKHREKMVEGLRRRCADPGYRASLGERAKAARADPAARERHREAVRLRWADPVLRAEQSDRQRRRYENPDERIKAGEASKRRWSDAHARSEQSDRMRKWWAARRATAEAVDSIGI